MKQTLLYVVILTAVLLPRLVVGQDISHGNWVVKKPFEQKVFIENKGQYELTGKASPRDILFYARQNGLQYYFTPSTIWISRMKLVKRTEKEIELVKQQLESKETEENDDDGLEYKRIEEFHEMSFVGASQNTSITGDSEVTWVYNYTIHDNLNAQSHAWKKLIYHNLYPGIDMEFYFPDGKEGFEYSFIIHPGADPSLIRINYNNKLKLNANGTLTVQSPFGDFVDLGPITSLSPSGLLIKCAFAQHNGDVTFNIGPYDKNQTLLIDPLVIPPAFTGNNSAFDLDWDATGNIYVYGGLWPCQILKYNSAGTLLWSYTTNFGGNNQYLGDFAVDRHSQSVYVTEGRDASASSAIALKLNSGGTQIAQYSGNQDFNEMWKIAFSTCSNQAVIAGGGSTTPSYTASYLDTNLASLSLVNTLSDTVSGFHDMWDLALDNFGNCYMVSAHSLYSNVDMDSFNNVLLKLPLPTLAPTTWMVHSNYDLLEHGSLRYGLNNQSQPSNGFNGMNVSDTTLYTYDSYVLKEWGTGKGKLLDSVLVNGTSKDNNIYWGGLTSDDCGNVFLGSRSTIKQYDYNLNLVQNFIQPDTIFDVRLSTSDMLYACGVDFISSTTVSLPSCHIINVSNKIKNVNCDTLGSATVTPTGGTAPYSIIWNTVPLQKGNTATGLKAGTYIATITDSSCSKQIYLDTIKITSNAIQIAAINGTICSGGSVALSASGGSTYIWTPSLGLNSTTGSSVVASPTITSTYNVIGISAGGCQDTVESVVTVNPTPSISVINHSPICYGGNLTLSANGATFYTWTPSVGLNTSSGSSVIANPAISTTYTIVGTSGGTCADTIQTTVTVNPNPIITITNPLPICLGGSATLSVSGASSYLWTPSIGLNSATDSSVIASPTITTTYTVVGLSGGNCSDTIQSVVTVNPNPSISATTPLPICSGTSAIIMATGATAYSWSPSAGLNTTTGAIITSSPTITTTYSVTGTDGNGCQGTTTVTVDVNPALTITIPPAAPICTGNSTTLTASGATTYLWTPSGGLNKSTGASVIANPTTTTTYTVTGSNPTGCSGTTTVVVNVSPTLNLSVAPPAPICVGSSTTLTANGAANYTWSPSVGLSATTGSSIIADPSTSTTYTVTGTSGIGCSGTTSVIVPVLANPVLIVNPPPPICQGNNVTVTVKGGATSYTWSPSAGLNVTTGSSVTANPTITSTYIITGIDLNGCSGTNMVTINVNPNPTITTIPPAPVCDGSTTTLKASGAVSYEWSPSAGLNSTTGAITTANPTATTTYLVKGIDGNGCSSTTNTKVVIYPLPIISVLTPPAICRGDSTVLTAKGAISYIWSPAIGLSDTMGSTVIAKAVTTRLYSVSGKDANGCVGKTSVVVNIIPNPNVTASSPPPVCKGQSQRLTASGATSYSWSPSTGLNMTTGSTVIANPVNSTTYTVTGTNDNGCPGKAQTQMLVMQLPDVSVFGLNSTYCVNSSPVELIGKPKGGIFYGSGVSNDQFNPSLAGGPGDYWIKYIYKDSNGCEDSSMANINIDPLPKVIVTPSNPTVCSGIPVTLNVMGATSYIWRPSTGLSDSTSSTVSANPTASTTYVVTGMNADSCFDTAMVTINVDSIPDASFTPSIQNYCDPMTMSFANTSDDGNTYSWDFGDGSTSIEINPQHTYSQGGVYRVRLTVTSQHGCVSDTVEEVVVKQAGNDFVQIGNAFTPNGDGINDVITPRVLCDNLSGYVFRVYNRWGQLLFQSYDPNEGWDGHFQGQTQILGVYDYYVEFNCGGCKIFKKGNISLLK